MQPKTVRTIKRALVKAQKTRAQTIIERLDEIENEIIILNEEYDELHHELCTLPTEKPEP